jgi:prepilin-type N-terminal cleavage/methylation domain-containing protein
MERTMTPSSPPEQPSRRSPRPSARGFTLIELLVVMGIILVLVTILLPTINRARRDATRTSMAADFAVIVQALDQYRNDFGDYPRTGTGATTGGNAPGGSVPVTGAAVLCWALVGPGPAYQDGAGMMNGAVAAVPDNGAPGFRLRLAGQGRVYGPYISLDRFRIGNVTTGNSMSSNAVTSVPIGVTSDDATCVLADRYGNIILYYPANTTVSPRKTGLVNQWTIGTPPQAVYNFSDNSTTVSAAGGNYPPYIAPTSPVSVGQSTLTTKCFAYRLGHTTAFSSSPSGPIPAGEVPVVVPYVLWSAGPDGQFGPQVDPSSGLTTGEDDDVVYPDQLLSIPAGQKP